MARGILNTYIVPANIPIATDIVPGTIGLTSPIAASQTQKLRWWVPFSVGATGGIRAIITVPAAGTLFNATIMLVNTVAPAIVTAAQAASAAFTNALANAGTHWLAIEATIVNGVNAGNVDLEIAQNSSDALTLTVLRGGYLEAVIL